MANNATSAAGTLAPSNIPGLSQEIRNLRRPLNTGVYYSCTQQEWDNLCRQTLVPATKAKATTALMDKSRAGKIHETADGEAALARCSACAKGNNGNGYDCYLLANGTAKTCAHCAFSHKSKCNAQRAPAGANNPVAPPPAVMYPAVVAAPAPPPPFFVPPVAAPRPASFVPPVQQSVSGPADVADQVLFGPYFLQPARSWMDEDIDEMADMGVVHAKYLARRDQEGQH